MSRLPSLAVLLSIVFCLTSAVQAQGPMEIGFFFDPIGDVNCLNGVIPGDYGPGFLYLLAINPIEPCQTYGVGGWECRLEITGPLTVLDWGLQPGAMNVATFPDFVVGHASPVPFAPAAILMDLVVSVTGSAPIAFRILPPSVQSFPGWPALACSCDLCEIEPLANSTGMDEFGNPNVSATINGDCVVQDDATSWGSVKALYR